MQRPGQLAPLLGSLLLPVGLTLFVAGLLTHSQSVLAICALLVGWMYCLRDLLDDRPDSISVMTVYGFSSGCWYGLGNLAGYVAKDTSYEPFFYVYESLEHIFPAQVALTMAALIPLYLFDLLNENRNIQLEALPRVGFPVSRRWLYGFSIFLTALCWCSRLFGVRFSFLGALSYAIDLGPNVAIFLITSERIKSRSPPPESYVLPIGLLVIEAVHQFLFQFMRTAVLWPILATILPYVLAKRVRLLHLVIGSFLFVGFIWLSKQMSEVRATHYGQDRISAIMQHDDESADLYAHSDEARDQMLEKSGLLQLLARFSTFNQVSQCVRITEEETFLKGETIEYAVYLFIPRFLWPNKPQIRPGQWFARKLGRGSERGGGSFSNAINMTIPGELYLNFGFGGIVFGLVIMTLLYWLVWKTTSGEVASNNPIGLMCRLFLLHQAIFNGSHLGALFHLVITYLLCMALTYLFSLFVPVEALLSERSAVRSIRRS